MRPVTRALSRAAGALALLVAIAAVEGASRLVVTFPAIPRPGPSDRGLWTYDATKGWCYRPGARGQVHVAGPDEALVRINSLGLRGPEVSTVKPAGTVRTLVLGDSFAFGLGVDESHTFAARLSELLNRDSKRPHEVVNMGVSGYSTDQELILFEELGRRLAPDLVVLVMCDNDFDGNLEDFSYQAYYKPYFEREGGALVRRNVPVPTLTRIQRTKLWLGRESNLWNAVRSRRASVRPARAVLGLFQVAVPREPADDPVALAADLLRLLRARAEEVGARLVFLNTGHRKERTTLFQTLRRQVAPEGFAYVGLEGMLAEARAARPDGAWDFPNDSHWNVDSHRLAAEVVHEWLRRRGWN